MIKTPKEKMVYFRVCFEGMTDRAREFWAEGKYNHAFKFLQEGFGLEKEQCSAVLNGSMKLAQDPEGLEGIDGILLPDSWSFNEEYSFYPDPCDPILAAENHKLHQENQELRQELEWQKEDQKDKREYVHGTNPDAYTNGLATIHSSLWDKSETLEERTQRMNLTIAVQHEAEGFRKHLLEADTKPTPKPDTTYKAGNGWILPNGKFYPLESSMQHIWCAERLGKTEKQAEDLGWIKISTSAMGLNVLAHKKMTQKQINTLFDWAKDNACREDKAKDVLEHWNP